MLEAFIGSEALKLGFACAGIALAHGNLSHGRFLEWLKAGCAGDMRYLEKNAKLRENPASLLPEAKSVVTLGASYSPDTESGFSGYVSVRDYHTTLRHKAGIIAAGIEKLWHTEQQNFSFGHKQADKALKWRVCVDSAPLPERDLAVAAGLGWFGGKGYVLNKSHGCLMLFCEIILNIALQPSAPAKDLCGDCDKCLRACPTGAIRPDRLIDARKCISYITIEHKGVIDETLRPLMGNSIFGCDRCGAACPFNNHAHRQRMTELYERPSLPSASECLEMTPALFETLFKNTAVYRTGLEILKRNAAIVIGNSRDTSMIPVLQKAIELESDLVKTHAVWAVERIKNG